MKKNHGFSLIELMVVIAVIAILSLIGINGYSSAVRKGRDARRKADVNAIAQALALYRMDKGRYPDPVSEYEDDAEATGFLRYIERSQLTDPDSKNKGGYYYLCWKNGAGANATCRSFLVCANMELNDNMNWKWSVNSGKPPAEAIAAAGHAKAYTSGNAGSIGTPETPTGVGGTENWYCVASI